VDDPPASLFRRDPAAFQLWVEIREAPGRELTVAEAARLTSTTPGAARRALAELSNRGVLVQFKTGQYRAAKTEQTQEPRLAVLTCIRCGTSLGKRQRKYCSLSCSRKTSQRRAAAARAENRKEVVRLCAVCGARIPVTPANKNRVYCSSRCKYLRERQLLLQKAIADGTSGVCETCGRPTRTAHSRWCSPNCRSGTTEGNAPQTLTR
jgi:endogenous inhibitor of DNA gyrase (YacG/DUF329 family)